tara:strand:- start:323 stop:628 length:306 start_codon:yes stop_codon:yes gene_type:complete
VLSEIKDDEEQPDATRREAAQLLASGGKEKVLAWVLEWAKTREEDWRRAERLSDALREIRETRDATLQDDSSTRGVTKKANVSSVLVSASLCLWCGLSRLP